MFTQQTIFEHLIGAWHSANTGKLIMHESFLHLSLEYKRGNNTFAQVNLLIVPTGEETRQLCFQSNNLGSEQQKNRLENMG